MRYGDKRRDGEMKKGKVKLGVSDGLDIKTVKAKVNWPTLTKRLNDNEVGFVVDHYHGTLVNENEEGETFQDVVHIDADTGAMNSTLMGVGDELPSDFQTLVAHEWHE